MAKKKLPKHLKKLARNIDAGKDIKGKPLSNFKRKKIASLLGAKFFKSKKGKIKKV